MLNVLGLTTAFAAETATGSCGFENVSPFFHGHVCRNWSRRRGSDTLNGDCSDVLGRMPFLDVPLPDIYQRQVGKVRKGLR